MDSSSFSSISNAPPLPPSPLRPNAGTITRVDFTHRVFPNVTLKNDTYHVQNAPNNPLFDSFTINVNETTPVISLLQTIASQARQGSAGGHPVVRQIMNRVREILEAEPPDVKIRVVYFLICPVDESDRNWEMPAGWEYGTTGTTRSDRNCGDSYCIHIPPSLRVCCVYSLLIS